MNDTIHVNEIDAPKYSAVHLDEKEIHTTQVVRLVVREHERGGRSCVIEN